MTDFNQFHDSLNLPQPPAKKMPDMINVLTILTFIGCGVFFLSAIYSYFMACKSVEMLNKMGGDMSDNPMSGMMGNALEMAQRQCEMRLPIFIVTVICLALCFVGALQMRKLKKTGFFIYTLGEVVAPIASLILIGVKLSGFALIGSILSFIFILLFVILYGTQLKHMR